ncbi:MAG: ABC transporter substrate-binding protein [Nitrospinota bacterium]
MTNPSIRLLAASALAAGLMAAGSICSAAALNVGATSATSSLIMFVATDKGYFAKHGIDVKLFVRNTGPELSKSLDAGEIDLAPAAITNIPVALERGLDVRAVVNYVGGTYTKEADDDSMGIVVRGDSGIGSVAGLKGKKVGATFGTGSDLYLQEVMKKHDLAPAMIERVNVPPPSSVALLDAGGLHAMVTWEPYVTSMLDKVKGSRLLIRNGGFTCFCASLHGKPERVYRDRGQTQAFVDAMAEAAFFVREPKNLDAVAAIAARYIPGMDPGIIKRTHKHWTYDVRIGENTHKAFSRSARLLVSQKKMQAPYDPAKYYDFSFIRRTLERHPEWFKDLPPGS